jgi:hypothetical protein
MLLVVNLGFRQERLQENSGMDMVKYGWMM